MDLYGGGSISQMDRLRVCLYISRKTETERRSSLFAVHLFSPFVSPVLSPRVLILPTEESMRVRETRFRYRYREGR